ncbi:MAG: hypothetical protein IJU19_06955 [Bacteroidales bacterium]|nr:hypothetical protein [Bacteroidales bacterium]
MVSAHNKGEQLSFEETAMNRKAHIILLVACLVAGAAQSQEADSTALRLRLGVGTSVESGFGRVRSLTWVAPRIEWHPSERLTLTGGFAAVGSLLPEAPLQGIQPRNYAPLRQGTRANMLWGKAEVQVGERTWLWGKMAYAGGWVQPLWGVGARPVEAVAFSGGMAYEMASGRWLELHVSVLHDRYGTLPEAVGLGRGCEPWGGWCTWGSEPWGMAFGY